MQYKTVMPSHFTDLPNEIVLIIWMYLTHTETIKSFSLIKCQRYIQLLESYCYKSIDFYTTTFSTFQLCCTQLLDQFRLNVQILKLGHRNYYSQIRLFSHYCLNSSSLIDLFPQLQTLVLRNVHNSDANELVPYLSIISFLEKLTLHKCPLNKLSLLICEHLFNSSIENRLNSCILHSNNQKDGLSLSEHLPSSYQPNYSLTYLQIDVRDLVTLKYLLKFLPNLLILDVHLAVDVTQSDENLFSISFNPCCYLIKLIMRLRNMVVLNFSAIVKFIHLFQNNLQTLHLILIHQDLNFRDSLTYIDGHRIFNDIIIQMKMIKDFSFWIETTCLCDQQMNNIIHSFQTEYWLTMHIGCYYDSINNLYVMFSLPFILNHRFMIMNDIIYTHFNHSNDHLNCLIPMVYKKMPDITILIGENESLCKLFVQMLKQETYRKKSIRIKPDGIYQIENNDGLLRQFNHFELRRRYENQSSNGFVNTTINWLSWMPHLRILDIDNELLSELILNDFNLNNFLFLEILTIRQTNKSFYNNNEVLTILNRLGRSSSLHTIYLQQYRTSLDMTINNLYLLLYEISHKFNRLELMIVDFHKDDIFDNQILEQLTDLQKKNCHLDYIYFSNMYTELCFAR